MNSKVAGYFPRSVIRNPATKHAGGCGGKFDAQFFLAAHVWSLAFEHLWTERCVFCRVFSCGCVHMRTRKKARACMATQSRESDHFIKRREDIYLYNFKRTKDRYAKNIF